MNHSTPGIPVPHQLPEFTQTHVHRVGDAIQPSHPLPPSSPFALSLSQNQGFFPMSQLFASGGQSIGASASESIFPKNIQGCFPLGLTGLISLLSKGLSRVFSSTTVQKHQFFSAQASLWPNSPIHTCCCCCRQVTSIVSDSVRPHRQQPTRLHCPQDSPGKNTGVGCHFLLQ